MSHYIFVLWNQRSKTKQNKKTWLPQGEETRFNPNLHNISQAGCCRRRSPATPPPPRIGSPPPWVTPASQRGGQPSTWEAHPSSGRRARFWWATARFLVGRAPHLWAPQPLLVARPRSLWGVLPTAEAPRPRPSERHSCPKGRLFNSDRGQIVWSQVCVGRVWGARKVEGSFLQCYQIQKISKPKHCHDGIPRGLFWASSIVLFCFFDIQKLWDWTWHQGFFCSSNCFGLNQRCRLVSQDTW